MESQGSFYFFPQRLGWIGLCVLSLSFLLPLPFLGIYRKELLFSPLLNRDQKEKENEEVYSFSLGLKEQVPGLSIPNLKEEMTFSFDPPRPDGTLRGKRVLVRMKKSGDSRRVVLPCRLDLEFQGDQLKFSEKESVFWLELFEMSGLIEGQGFITALDDQKIDAGRFQASGHECPLQRVQEFPEGSPFRVLADARWWGHDQFRSAAESGERIEIGNAPCIDIQMGQWLVWKEEKWQKSEAPEKDLPIAHIQTSSPKELILEAWDADGHTRIALSSATLAPFRLKPEELFSSIRVRSEKQISCMLEKQCIVLKTGDWVLKTSGRWKILRKKDEKDAFLSGKLFGELFILEQISQKQGQKMIQGRLFNPGRTQVVSIELPAQSGRKTDLKRGKSS